MRARAGSCAIAVHLEQLPRRDRASRVAHMRGHVVGDAKIVKGLECACPCAILGILTSPRRERDKGAPANLMVGGGEIARARCCRVLTCDDERRLLEDGLPALHILHCDEPTTTRALRSVESDLMVAAQLASRCR